MAVERIGSVGVIQAPKTNASFQSTVKKALVKRAQIDKEIQLQGPYSMKIEDQ